MAERMPVPLPGTIFSMVRPDAPGTDSRNRLTFSISTVGRNFSPACVAA